MLIEYTATYDGYAFEIPDVPFVGPEWEREPLPVETTTCRECGAYGPCYVGQDDLGNGSAWCIVDCESE